MQLKSAFRQHGVKRVVVMGGAIKKDRRLNIHFIKFVLVHGVVLV